MIYGYCRVSTPRQRPERQESNIKAAYPDAVVVFEKGTGKNLNRPVWKSLQGRLQSGDTVVFDEVSRMSRDAEEGFALYKTLYESGVNLVFLKEPHLNTQLYRETWDKFIPPTGTDVDLILEGINCYLLQLAERQIEVSFEGAEKEVQLLRQRTSEGVKRAQIDGKQIGREKARSRQSGRKRQKRLLKSIAGSSAAV